MQDAIIMLDMEGKISYWNEAASRIFGYSCNEVMGREMHTFLAPGNYFDDYRKGFPHFKQTGEEPYIGRILELLVVKKDGTSRRPDFSARTDPPSPWQRPMSVSSQEGIHFDPPVVHAFMDMKWE